MKKIILTLLAVVMSVFLVLGLVACNNTGNNGDNSSNSVNNTGSTQGTSSSEEGGTSSSNPTARVSVTEQEWLAAFDTADNFTFEMLTSGIPMQAIAVDGEKIMMSATSMTYIYVKDGDDYCIYRFAENAWLKMPLTALEYNSVTLMPKAMLNAFKNDYSAFTLTDDGTYTCASIDKTQDLNGVMKNIKVKFIDGALVGMEFEVEGSPSTYAISKVGSTVIELPTEYTEFDPSTEQPQKMSEAAWQQAFMAFANEANFSLAQSDNDGVFAAMSLDGERYYETYRSGAEYIYDFDGSNFYKYSKSASSAWVKANSTQAEYNEVIEYASTLVMGAAQAIAYSYNSFEYTEGKYTATSLTITTGFTLKNIELTFNGNELYEVTCDWIEGSASIVIYNIGTTYIELPKDFTDNTTTVKNSQVNEKEWYVAFNNVNNFTMTTSVMAQTQTFKLDGDKRSMESDGEAMLLTKEGESYFMYVLMEGDWYKMPMEAEMVEAFNQQAQMMAYFADLYNKFTYSDGKYVCKTLDTGDYMGVLKNVEIVFENGEVVSVVFDIEDDIMPMHNEVTNIGTTTVEVPSKYTDISEMM